MPILTLDKSSCAAQSVVWKQRGPDHNREDPGIPEQHAEHLDRLLKAFCRQRQPDTLFRIFVSFLKANEAFDFFVVILLPVFFFFFVLLFFDEIEGFQLFFLLLPQMLSLDFYSIQGSRLFHRVLNCCSFGNCSGNLEFASSLLHNRMRCLPIIGLFYQTLKQ